MFRLKRAIFLAATLAAACLPSASRAEVFAPALIKGPDSSAVYYYGMDGRRHAFPNEKVYFSWYADFKNVVDVGADELASIPLGMNVSYRPGTRLVKIPSIPKVYAVEPGKILRWVEEESFAKALYGDEWAKRVDDLSEALFIDYAVGASIGSASWPSGSFVRRKGDQALFYMEGGAKRRVAAGAVQGLDIQERDVIETSSDLAEYPDGATIGTAEPDIIDVLRTSPVTEIIPPSPAGPSSISAAALPAASAILGARDVILGSFEFTASASAPGAIRSITFRGYINEDQGDSDFAAGSDDDNGTATFLRLIVLNATLHDAAGTRLAGPEPVFADGTVVFKNLAINWPIGTKRAFTLKGDLNKGLDLEGTPDKIAFDIASVDGGEVAPVNGGTTPTQVLTIKKTGTADFRWSGQGGAAIVSRAVPIGTLAITSRDESFILKRFSLRTIGQVSSVQEFRLEYGQGESARTVTWPYGGSLTTFEGLTIPVAKDATTSISVKAIIKPKGFAVSYGEIIRTDLPVSGPISWSASSTGETFTEFNLGTPEFTHTSSASSLNVRYSDIAFAKASDAPGGQISRGSAVTILKWTVTAQPEGPVRIKKLGFKLTPGDAGVPYADNDAIERWADVNGDFPDDNELVNLWQATGASERLLGEDSSASVAYTIVASGTEDTTPEGHNSAAGDYAYVRYDFNRDFEIKVEAGQTDTFRLEIDTSKFASGGPHSFKVEMLSGNEFEWTDTTVGAYEPMKGDGVNGLPMTADLQVPL
jgi:hypothetical protein